MNTLAVPVAKVSTSGKLESAAEGVITLMATTLTASRVVAGEPAVALLLITGPGAADFLPQTTLQSVEPGQVSGMLRVADGDERALRVMTSPPRRTPTAYIAEFRVQVEGAPPASGALHVTSAGPRKSRVSFSLTADAEMPELLDSIFDDVTGGFLDGLERAALEQNPAA